MASRGLWHLMGVRTRRGLALSWSALFVLSLLLQYFSFALAPAALAVHDEDLFELDGNTANSGAVVGDDWDSHPNATGNRALFITDPLSQQTDDIFTGGSTKDDLNTSGWKWTTGSVPDKDNIEHAFAVSYEKNGHTFVYFGLDRYANNGDAFTGFWFFKSGVGPVAGGSFSGPHQVGDLLVLSNFTNGGATATIQLFEWVGSGGDTNGTLDLLGTGQACTGAPALDIACAATNSGDITPSWSFDDKGAGGASNPIPAESFFEGGIDLDQLFDGNAPCFGSFLAETRASQSVDAVLKDFAGGSFNTCVPPTIATAASASTVHFGETVTDTATLSGSDGPASGVIRFFLCGPAGSAPDCSTGGTQLGSAVNVTTSANGGTATSVPFNPAADGSYCFRAEYTPDASSQYLAGKHTNQTTECFTVVKNDTSISTAAAQSVNVGAQISDSATLTGATSDAGGHIVFRLYGPDDANCSSNPIFTSADFAVSGNGTYGPAVFTPDTAGTYRWKASYSGDAKNTSAIGACNDTGENDTVNKVNPTIATQASATVVVGGKISDTATVSGGHAPTGTVTFKLYGPNDATCATVIFTSADRPLSAGSATSAEFTTTQAGTYRWIATYNGDANNNAVSGACNDTGESVVVSKAAPTIATELVGGGETGTTISIPLGSSVHDTSALTGATATAGGTVHYQVFSDSSCTTKFADAGTMPVVNHVPADSTTVTFNQSGNYYWQADYSGDANNNSASSNCSLEVVSIGLNEPTITTNASDSVVVGGDIHDTATLAGGFNPTGSITFRLYGPNDATCTGGAIDESTVAVDGNGTYASDSFTTSVAGTYRWIATYSGDANNAAAAGACNDADESVIVTTPNLHAVKLVATGDGPFGPTSTAEPGDIVNYQITVTNSGNADATNVPVSDDISDILAHATYNADCSDACSLNGDTLHWIIPSIAKNGGSEVLTFSVTLDADFPTGITHLPNVVVVTGPGSNCAAGSEDADCDTDTTVSESSLTIDKTLADTGATDPDLNVPSAQVGDTLHYTLAYTGHGPITNAVITDVLPVGIEYVAGSAAGDANFTFDSYNAASRTLTWKAATLPDPATGSVTYDAKVAAAAPDQPQPLVNTASIVSDQTPIDSDTAEVAVLAPPEALTPPPTDTFSPRTASSNPGFALMLILLGVAGLALGIGFITPAPARVRRRDRLG
jgi:uncharacterized repeat protein (TIGR01451 family)